MRAFQVTGFRAEPALADIATPSPLAGEVLLDIHACGLNFADLLMAKGTYQDTPTPPFVLGMEVCGTVLAQGKGVTTPPIGTRVGWRSAGFLMPRPACPCPTPCRLKSPRGFMWPTAPRIWR